MKTSQARFIKSIVLSKGKQYKPAILPAGIGRGNLGDCFDWCMLQAMNNRHLCYVEGLAQNPEDPESFVYHAWLTDGIHAFDPTWKAIDNNGIERPLPVVYLGVEMDMMEVAAFVSHTKYKGILANQWRAPGIFEKMRIGELIA